MLQSLYIRYKDMLHFQRVFTYCMTSSASHFSYVENAESHHQIYQCDVVSSWWNPPKAKTHKLDAELPQGTGFSI